MFVSSTQAAHLMGISPRRIRQLLSQGRIQGALKIGKFWIIPLVEGMPQVREGTRGPQASWCTASRAESQKTADFPDEN
ncbi:MAG: helix-turn-helix domain-containing protein [Symploca sp. SIO2E9]|nr:helix-turn-helix domain-containing protein [Symploca sp. SIO2E9]